MSMDVLRAASMAAGTFTKGGQITISAWVDFETNGAKVSKKAVVSAAVLYIFQLPARTGMRIFQHTLRLGGRCSAGGRTRTGGPPHIWYKIVSRWTAF